MNIERDRAETLDHVAAWDRAAEPWNTFVESGADYHRTELHGPALLAACGPVEGSTVLDLGCGQGWFSQQLARSGATVTGVDLSPAQLSFAIKHEKEQPLGITYQLLDASAIAEKWSPSSFDLVTACMVLQDLPNADEVLHGVNRVLRPAGRFVFSIPHPVTDSLERIWERDDQNRCLALKINHYYDNPPRMVQWKIERLTSHWDTPYWHRTISEWSEIILDSGMNIRHIREPRPSPEVVKRVPKLEPAARLPFFLIFELVKST